MFIQKQVYIYSFENQPFQMKILKINYGTVP